ncbi:MAG: histidine kinase N-terminal 7TM domain-containing protein, partial [Elusimicrobiota bacterium]
MEINIFALSGLITFITTLSLGVLTWLKRRNKVHKLWSYFNFAAAIWGFGAFKFSSTLNKDAVFFWLYLSHIGVVFIPVFYLHFSLEFLEEKKESLIKLIYILGVIFFITNITDWIGITKIFIVSIRYVFNSFYVDSPPGPIYPIFVAFFFSSVGYAFYCGIKKLKKSEGLNKLQIKYFLIANGIGFLGGGTAFFMVFNIDIYPYYHLLVPLYPILTTYAIIKYRLMDIRVAITRGMIFGVVYILILGVPFGIAILGENTLFQVFGKKLWIIPVILTAAIASLGPTIYSKIKEKAEWTLFREQRKYRQALISLGKKMNLTRDLKELLNLITKSITKDVGVS